METYWTIIDPSTPKRQRMTREEQARVLTEFSIDFKKKFRKPSTLRNFEQAQ